MSASDAELVRSNDFGALYARHVEAVHGWFAARVAWAAADLTAETFARAWLGRRSFRDERDGSDARGTRTESGRGASGGGAEEPAAQLSPGVGARLADLGESLTGRLRQSLLHGLDPIARTLQLEDEIAAFEARSPSPVRTTSL